MSIRTLTTRVGGYKFVIETNGTHVIGEFDAENGDGMSLPYELRSCWTNNNGQTLGILAAAVSAVATLNDRVTNTIAFCECYRDKNTCDNCRIESRLHARQFSLLRGHGWETKYKKIRFH